jgi:quercetin dioxygenase-like cupin family protein
MIAESIGIAVAMLALAGTPGGTTAEKGMGPATGAKAAVLTPSDVKWGPGPKSLPPGAEAAVLDGNPMQKGAFAMRLKLPAGYTIKPHTHPRTERVTVISGKFQLGHGRTFDEAKLQDLEAGSFFSLPSGMEHFARAAEATVVQLNSDGPWEINYINPADDPRKAGSASR